MANNIQSGSGSRRKKIVMFFLFYLLFLFAFTLLLEILLDLKNWQQYFYSNAIIRRAIMAFLLAGVFVLWFTRNKKAK